MAWDISWIGNTRERLRELVRERFPKATGSLDIGELAVKKLAEEILSHPMPSAELPQYRRDEVFNFGGVQVSYHIDSERGAAEVRSVTVVR